MSEPRVSAQDVLNASKGMLQKQMYVYFTTPAGGMGPVMENLEAHLEYQLEIERKGIMFGAGPDRALPLADKGKTRSEIQAETDQVLGVHNCTLDVDEGEILVLMGLSGSGKSTLLRAVNGLNPVARGAVRVNDGGQMVDVTKCKPADLRRIRQTRVAMVFQQFGLLPWRTVSENVGFGLELAGMPEADRAEKVARQLELVGLSERSEAKVAELSGGMQQRVGLARAFATEAPILLMDEPFSALDPLIRTRLQDELLELQRDLRRPIVFVSHDLDEAFKLGGRIAIMEGGRIVQIGTPREIFSNPASDYVAEFVANMNPLEVLTARDVMGVVDGAPTQGETTAETPVRALMERLRGADAAIAVMEEGTQIGTVTAHSIVDRLKA